MIKYLTTFYLIAMPILLAHCAPTVQISENDKDQLDPNFAGYSGTLLIIRNYDNKLGYNSYDKSTIKAFRKYYKGDFIIISEKDLSNYPDLDKYRFFVRAWVSSQYLGSFNGRADYSHKSWYIMNDRKTHKEYKTKVYPGYIGMEKLPLAFEALRSSR